MGINLEEDEGFKISDYNEEIEKAKTLVESCKKELESNNVEAIPYFNEILNRELDAIMDTFTKIDHFHASARSARAS